MKSKIAIFSAFFSQDFRPSKMGCFCDTCLILDTISDPMRGCVLPYIYSFRHIQKKSVPNTETSTIPYPTLRDMTLITEGADLDHEISDGGFEGADLDYAMLVRGFESADLNYVTYMYMCICMCIYINTL